MDVIRGYKQTEQGGSIEAFTSAERGELSVVVDAIQAQTGRTIGGLLETLELEDVYLDRVNNSLSEAMYRVVGGDSIATDLDIMLLGNLLDELAQLRGSDSVKVHLSVFDAMRAASNHAHLPEGLSAQNLTWIWEIGRYVGRVIQRKTDARTAPLSIPSSLGIASFQNKIIVDMLGEDHDLTIPKPDRNMKEDYLQVGLPERLASAFGNVFMEYFYEINDDVTHQFNCNLREAVIRPYHLAHDFGNDFRPEITFRELAASHPLSNEELHSYLEYISRPSDIIYLDDK